MENERRTVRDAQRKTEKDREKEKVREEERERDWRRKGSGDVSRDQK